MYDVIILGAGPGGYVAAERAGALGKSVLLIEKEHLGGVCLNSGCIPTKTLLHSSKTYALAKDSENIGVRVENAAYDISKALVYKQKVIETLRKGIASQMKRFGVEVVNGEGYFLGDGRVRVGETVYEGKNIMLATGSSPVVPPIPGIDNPGVVTSTELLSMESLPSSVAVIGGGYIGMEFASFFANLGTEVTVIEMMDEIIPFMDPELSALLRKSIKGVNYELGAKVEKIEQGEVFFSREGKTDSVKAETILVSVGRKPNLENMGFQEAGLFIEKKGIIVDEFMNTNLPGVYAVGDVTGKSLLAHSASRMGEVAVAGMFDSENRQKNRMRYNAVPWVVFTAPEVAGCGMSEAEAKEAGHDVSTATLTMKASGRYLAEHQKERGICKVVADKKTGVILGVHMLGTGCSELIFGAAMMIETELRVKDVRQIIFPHPTISEVMRDTIWEIE